jgi:hypothetical protein
LRSIGDRRPHQLAEDHQGRPVAAVMESSRWRGWQRMSNQWRPASPVRGPTPSRSNAARRYPDRPRAAPRHLGKPAARVSGRIAPAAVGTRRS